MNSQNLPWISIISFISLTKLLVASQFPQYVSYPAELSHQSCGGSFSCGSITGVDYPFRGYGEAESCGYPGLVLDCQNNITTIDIKEMTFRVLGIDQASQTMKIAREDVMESGCPHILANTSIDNSLFEYYSGYENLTFLYDCSSSAIPKVSRISCKAPAGYNSVYLLSGKPLDPGSCDDNVTVPVSGWSGSTNSTAVQQAIQRGIEVRWKVDSKACSECTASNGRCGFEIVTNRTACYCPGETNTSDTCARATTPESSPTPGLLPSTPGADDEQYTNCSRLFQCGNLSNIGYPFWGGDRPNYCGDPSFELTCKSKIPEITIESTAYRVLAIDNTSQVLTVARNDYWNTVCPTQLHNASLDTTHFSYGSDSHDLMLYYNCQILNTITIPTQFNCSANSTSNSTGIFVASGATLDSRAASCDTSVSVRVNNTEAEALARASSVINVTRLLDTGFGLRWKANDTNCKLCVESGGQCGSKSSSGSNSSSFVCRCSDRPYALTCGDITAKGSTSFKGQFQLWHKIVIGVSASAFAIIILIITIYCLQRKGILLVNVMAFRKNESLEDQNVEAFIRQYGSLAPKHYRYSDINKMTNAFKEKLGEGGYGIVYKGKLSDGRLVAVKILNDTKGNGEEFINEVASISRTSHVNVVALLGFCFERSKRALIYEFVAKGSLDKFVYNNESLEWKTLYQIAIGVARGLEYLHRGCSTRIVHFDIKPHNILLDEDFCPKISDFGLAKLCQRKQSIISVMGARGTAGYIAPEMLSRAFGGVSHKSDVYSYGMLVLEITGARENPGIVQTSEVYFPQWIYEHLEHGKDLRLVRVPTREEEETARKMILVGLWCIQTHPSDRPSISKVLEMLEGSLESLQIPPKPSILSPLRLQTSACDSLSSTMNLEVEMSATNPSSFPIPSKQLQFSTARSGQPASSKTWA